MIKNIILTFENFFFHKTKAELKKTFFYKGTFEL